MESKKEEIEKQKVQIIKLREQLKAFKAETKRRTMTLITSAFGFVAALFWRDAIQSFLEQTIKVTPGEGLWIVQVVVASIVTVFAVIVMFILSRMLGK